MTSTELDLPALGEFAAAVPLVSAAPVISPPEVVPTFPALASVPSGAWVTPTPVAVERSWYSRAGKRALDLAIAVPAVIILSPLILTLALLVRVTMGQGVIFRQDRVGRGGAPFSIHKFRTMLHEVPSGASESDGPVLGLADERRVTRVGSLMRKLSLDELPQLWNVIRGEMSLIGPRPEVYSIAETTGTVFHPRHLVRPGITGMWQVSADRARPLHECLHHDVDYVRSLGLFTDLKILIRTVATLVHRTGV